MAQGCRLGRTAELVRDYLHKCDFMFVEGRMQSRKWRNGKPSRRGRADIVVRRILFLGTKVSQGRRRVASSPGAGHIKMDDGYPSDFLAFSPAKYTSPRASSSSRVFGVLVSSRGSWGSVRPVFPCLSKISCHAPSPPPLVS
jgi:single-stranded DNA-binding protein